MHAKHLRTMQRIWTPCNASEQHACHIAICGLISTQTVAIPIFHKQGLAVLQVQDFATVVFRMKALGFNTIKLPFSFEALYAGDKRPFYDGCQNMASPETLQKGLTEVGKGGSPFCCFAL